MHGNDRIEEYSFGETIQRQMSLVLRPAGEDCESESVTKTFQRAGPRDPALLEDQSIRAIAQEQRLEARHDVLEWNFHACSFDDVMREFPVVIEAALVFVFL